MLLRIFTEPQQGASYDQLLAVARTAEAQGFDAFFRSDHYMAMGTTDGLPGPTDAWVTLAAIARETTSIRLGTLVTSATFRLPGPLAISVAEVDDMSGGRVELGLGAGWYEAEHTAYGIPFPPLGERFERLDEQLAIITGLWSTPAGERFTFSGRHYEVRDSPALPKPVQRPGPPVIVGGGGPIRTPRLAARYGSRIQSRLPVSGRHRLTSSGGSGPHASRQGVIRPHWCCPPPRRCVADATTPKLPVGPWPSGRQVDELRQNGLCGTPDEVTAKLATFAAAGAVPRLPADPRSRRPRPSRPPR